MGFFDDAADFIDDKVDDDKDAVDDVADDVGEAAGDIVEGGSDVVDEVSEGDVGGAIDEAGDTVEDVASGDADTGSNPSSGSSSSGNDDSGVTVDVSDETTVSTPRGDTTVDSSDDSDGSGLIEADEADFDNDGQTSDNDLDPDPDNDGAINRPNKDPSELDPGEETTIKINNRNDEVNVDPIEMPDRDPSKPGNDSSGQDRFPTMPGVAVSRMPGESDTEYRNRVADARLDAQEDTIREQKEYVRNRIEERKKEVRNQYENDAIYTVDPDRLSSDVRKDLADEVDAFKDTGENSPVAVKQGTDKVEVSGETLQKAYINNLEQNREFVDQLDKDLQEVESQQETVQNTMMENDAIRERNQEIEEAREEFRKQQVADFFDKTDNTGGGGPPYDDAGEAARGLDSYFADQVEMSMQDFSEDIQDGKRYGGNSAGAQLVGDFIASGETLVNQSWDAVSGTDGGFNMAAFDSADVTNLSGAENMANPTRMDRRSDELADATVGQFAGFVVGIPDLANAGVSYAGRAFGGNAAAKYFTKEENMDKVRPFTPVQDATGVVNAQVQAAKEDPVKFGSTVAVDLIGSKGLGRAAKTTGTGSMRVARSTSFDDIARKAPGASSGSTFNANDLTSFDRLDPRTGFGRKPLPGEPAPDSYGSIASNKFQNFGDFVRGDLGDRPATPDEVRNRFDESDIIMGRNRPDGGDPSDPVTVPLSRREVVGEKLPDFEDSKVLDILGTKRKGQLHLTTKQRVKVKDPDVDADTSGPGTVDYLTPDDRRPVERARKGIDTGKEKVGNLIDDFDRPKPSPDVDSGQGTGLGLGAGLASNIGFDDFMDERNMLDQGLQPVNTVDSIQDPFFEDPQIQDPVRDQQVREPRMTDSIVPPPAPKLRDPEMRSPDRGRDSKRRRDDEESRESGLFFFDDFADQPQQRASKADFAPSLTALTFDIGGGSRDSSFSPFNVRALPDPSGGKGRKKQDNGFRDPLDFDR